MFKKVKKYIEKYKLIQQGDSIILGISGGADSVCLFFVLLELKKEMNLDLQCVHVNHNLRGQDAWQDQKFVEELCEVNQVICHSFSVNVKEEAVRRKMSLEEAGRECRRECFQIVRTQLPESKIATAHHENDNVETFLMNIARGTGLVGMTGIAPRKMEWIRPLLCVTRHEIEEYLIELGVSYCIDKTNYENIYTRNYMRNIIVPGLEKNVNLQVVSHINNTINELTKIEQYLNKQVQVAWECCIVQNKNEIVIEKLKYVEYDDIIQEKLMLKVLISLAGKQRDISRTHVMKLVQLMNQQVGKTVDLPYGFVSLRTFAGMSITSKELKDEQQTVYEYDIKGNQCIEVTKDIIVNFQVISQKDIENLEETPYTKYFDYDIIKGNLKIRSKRSGDYITINANGNRQTLKKFFTNNKVEQTKRQHIVLLAVNSEVLWIMGYRRCSTFRVSTKTNQVLKVQINGGNYGRNN